MYSVVPAKTNEVLMNILQKTPKLEVLEIPAAVRFIFLISACFCHLSQLTIILFLSVDLFSGSCLGT